MRIFVGLKRKLEFNLISPSGELLTPKPVQLLVIDAFPTSVDQSWGKLITDGFDADVIKCWADIDSDGQLTPISFSAGALDSVHNGQFEYTMRPCHSFPQMMKRLKKYRDRGFILSKFSFDERVSDEWREHIMQEFKLKYANRWWKEYVENADCAADSDDLPTIFTQNVLPYLGRFHGDNLSDGPIETTSQPDILDENQKKRHAIARGMLRRNVLKELVRTGYHDPGHNSICRYYLARSWAITDKEDDGVNMNSFWENIGAQFPSLLEDHSAEATINKMVRENSDDMDAEE